MTGEKHTCALIDGTIRQFPTAKIRVDTPYYRGKLEAMCMQNPICDLVIGNLPGAKGADAGTQQRKLNEWGRAQPNNGNRGQDGRPHRKGKRQATASSEVQQGKLHGKSAMANAVVTKTKAKKAGNPLTPPAIASTPSARRINVRGSIKAQREDLSLEKLQQGAGEGKQITTRGRTSHGRNNKDWERRREARRACGQCRVNCQGFGQVGMDPRGSKPTSQKSRPGTYGSGRIAAPINRFSNRRYHYVGHRSNGTIAMQDACQNKR